MFLLASSMTSSSDELGPLFLRAFWRSRKNAFGDELRRQKYITKITEAIWTISFKIRAKIEINKHLSVRLTSQTRLILPRVN